ncbi:MAG: hypothetical protein Q8Q52_06955, partial [Acidimicrobiia bacterium]|nr:hypothetical protein [Acidimicrobiia bacterium]
RTSDVFDWIGRFFGRIAEWIYRRGQAAAGAADLAKEERRTAVRTVRDAISEAMAEAERDRLHGSLEDQNAAITAASRAGAVMHEVDDDEARRLVTEWKALFDAIPKGWMKQSLYGNGPLGYPQAEWDALRSAAQTALDRLGFVLRELMK